MALKGEIGRASQTISVVSMMGILGQRHHLNHQVDRLYLQYGTMSEGGFLYLTLGP